jgi:gluconolactonase
MPLARRALLGAAATSLAAPALAQWQPASRYPDPAIEILDPAFARYRIVNAAVERLSTGHRWCEGPCWFGEHRMLIWSDIPNNRIFRWNEATGQVDVFREPAGFANGNTRDRQGRLITCEHGGRRVVRTEYDGRLTVLADRFDGKRLNSPNDVVVKSDDSIWFTDPPFGILGHYTGDRAPIELPLNVYRIDPRTGQMTVVIGDIDRPNGLAFSLDEKLLYVVESGVNRRAIHVYDVAGDGDRVANGRIFHDAGPGTPDGFALDTEGNLWCGWGMGDPKLDGVMVFNPAGKLIGRIALPERCAHVAFGGRRGNRLFMAASQSLYALYVGTQGAGYS